MIRSIMNFLQGWASRKGSTETIHDAAFAATVLLSLCWLSHGVYKGHGFDPGWNQAFLTLAGLVCLVKGNADRVGGSKKEGE